ncbi:NDP-hexose 2,3-dehydratase family protein [Streptomyces beihaiensis]|uniref:NDP-hexose 2,3-dehydratase family protein n=1 Tax=Streptomyces beihaiensis TaxID=2984495 RepID=A0ABT3TYK2_9ACTN|nr:NDP-hexose 2,3-dehydratase family protein [Streptomyces beihaiensis]MCX3062124.1 NDP-hexose 2,3-dehydratase family protein [Streptomyces beihaiensis]
MPPAKTPRTERSVTEYVDSGRRFTRSASLLDSTVTSNDAFDRWFADQRVRNRFEVDRIPFKDLRGWQFHPKTGNLGHTSGRFFTVEGLRVETDWGHRSSWAQPIINQPEIGILGIVVKEFDGVLHCLMQAKMEPGNLNTIQLSPTVQATRSNFTGVHGGREVTFIEYFRDPERGRVVVDSLQSEQASWFLRKRNRNVIVEVAEEIPPHENFVWLTIGQIHRLLLRDNIVNMDARTVLSCIPFDAPNGPARWGSTGPFRESLVRSMSADQGSLHRTSEVLNWLTDLKSRHALIQHSVPLREVELWHVSADEISHETGKYFTVVAADVQAHNREVASWTQPLLAPVERGRAAMFVRQIDGVLHLLLRVRPEAGVLNVAEFGPTVQCQPGDFRDLPKEQHPPYLDQVLTAEAGRLRYDAVQSEEGGRFYHAENRYQIIEVGEEFELEEAPGCRWMTVHQVMRLLAHSNYLNIQARSLLAGLQTIW